MALSLAFTWTEDLLPGWRGTDDRVGAIVLVGGDRPLPPAEAVKLTGDAGGDTTRILTETALALCERASPSETSTARGFLDHARMRLQGGAGPTEEVERFLERAEHHLDDPKMKRSAGMLAEAVRVARDPPCPVCDKPVPHRGPWTAGGTGPAFQPAQTGTTCPHCGAELLPHHAERKWRVAPERP